MIWGMTTSGAVERLPTCGDSRHLDTKKIEGMKFGDVVDVSADGEGIRAQPVALQDIAARRKVGACEIEKIGIPQRVICNPSVTEPPPHGEAHNSPPL